MNNYELGMMYWNRGQMDQAKSHLDRVMFNLQELDAYEKEKLIEFYSRVNDKNKLLEVYRLMIRNEESLPIIISNYLDMVGEKISDEELLKFENFSQVRLDHEVTYKLAKTHLKKGNRLKSYGLLTELLDQMESNYKTSFNEKIYVRSVLKVIRLEYELDNFVQSRFQVKKLINKNFDIEDSLNEQIIYWAIVLNIFGDVLKNKKWSESIRKVQHKELRVLVYVMLKIYKGDVNEKLIDVINATVFNDTRLKYRAKVTEIYLKKGLSNRSWKIDIDDVDVKKCYLAVLMKYEKSKHEYGFDKESFLSKYYKYHSDIPQIINSFWNRNVDVKSKNLDDVSIQFIGGADGIGGSSVLVTYKGAKILLDAGANINNSEFLPNYECMKEQGVDIEDINYLIISHAHLDHTGASPYIYNQNPNIKIISTCDTKDIMKVMLEDTVKINERKGIDIFNAQDVKNLVSNIDVVDFDKEVKLSDDISMTLYRAGHILGAACIYLKIKDTGVLYTGDYSVNSQYTVDGIKLPKDLKVDILITESTYAYHPTNFDLDRVNQEKLLVEEILKATKDGGVVLIPAFAVGRAQEIVLLIKEYFKDEMFLPFDLYIDGKVVEVCSIYENSKVYEDKEIYGKGVTTVNDRYQGKNEIPINKFRGSCIIASSGMLNDNSRSSKYASTIIEDKDSLILFSGYLDEESPGRQIINEIRGKVVPVINLEGRMREVRCKVKSYKLSAHVKKNQIVELIAQLRPKNTFIVHGDVYNKYKYFDNGEIGKEIYPDIEEMLKYLKDCNIVKPKNGEIFKVVEM